jgi:hypothetical protein
VRDALQVKHYAYITRILTPKTSSIPKRICPSSFGLF